VAALDRGVLELTADVDGDGTDETGAFHLVGNVTVSEEVEKDFIFDNTASGLVSLVSDLSDVDIEPRKGFYLDIGAGAHVFEIEFRGWEGANAVPWGDGSGTYPADATGEDPLRQMQCFLKYLQLSTTDSFSPATLRIGEYADGTYGANGAFDPLEVAVQGPRNTHTAEEYSTFDGTFTAIEVLRLNEPIDLTEHAKRGAE
jgi:hypothetical protein